MAMLNNHQDIYIYLFGHILPSALGPRTVPFDSPHSHPPTFVPFVVGGRSMTHIGGALSSIDGRKTYEKREKKRENDENVPIESY